MRGSWRVVASSTDTILDDCDFDPFGGEKAFTSCSANRYKFTGVDRFAVAHGMCCDPDPLLGRRNPDA